MVISSEMFGKDPISSWLYTPIGDTMAFINWLKHLHQQAEAQKKITGCQRPSSTG
jgi:hypothetical protein